MDSIIKMPRYPLVAAAVASALCSASAFAGVSIVQGVVGGAYFTPPVFADTAAASTGPSTAASVYQGAKVCFDLNGNGACDPGEPYTMTAENGSFRLSSTTLAPLVAEISTSATNNGNLITARDVFRVNMAQIQAATVNPLLPATVNITPLSTEVALAIENQGVTFAQAKANLAQRIGVSTSDVLLPPTQATATDLAAILKESVIAQGRLTLAAKFVDRGDTVGELRGNFDCPNVTSFDPTNADACTGADLNSAGTIPVAEAWAYNLEGMPRYDYVFVIFEENESQSSVVGSAHAPFINSVISQGGLLYNYYSTGDPSEPNYLAVGSADDWGQTGDEAIPYPAVTGVKANLWNSIDATGLSWRVYEGSLWPSPAGTTANMGASSWNSSTGGLWFDNPSESSILGADGSTYASSLRAEKHNPAVWFADAAAQPDFPFNDRSVSGAYGSPDVNGNPIPYTYAATNPGSGSGAYTSAGDWDTALQSYATGKSITSWWSGGAQPWTEDQFLLDLQNGTVGNYNFIVPDQDDDMHNTGVVPRADYWAENMVKKIESSALWNDPTKNVAIVITYDEGESATTACCGWNPERSGDSPAQLVTFTANGTYVSSAATLQSFPEAFNGATFNPPKYSNGNHGHGVTTFTVYTNQQAAGSEPGGIYDTDYYSHFSFVRTLQDMFGLADPGLPGSYMNRSKFTETFINENATVLPEFAGSANPHFDAVRSMNHVYEFPATVTRVVASGGVAAPVTTGPDPTQDNLWATPHF